MRNNMWEKGFVFTVIFLFLGLAFTPSINANIGKSSSDSELVETTIEVYGIDGVKSHKVMLSQEQLDEVNNLFDSLQKQLNESQNREESIKILNNAVVELDKIGVLPKDMTIQEAQQLVTGRFQNPKIIKLMENLHYKRSSLQGTYSDYLCLMAGSTTHTVMLGPVSSILSFFSDVFYRLEDYYIQYEYWKLCLILDFVATLFALFGLIVSPISIFNPIGGCSSLLFGTSTDIRPHPAEGWMWILGLTGGDMWVDSDFYGSLSDFMKLFFFISIWGGYLGAAGFTGFGIGGGLIKKNFIGTALAVSFDVTK